MIRNGIHSDWIPVEREVKIPIDMDRMILKVRTKSQAGSNNLMKVRLCNEDDTFRSVHLKFANLVTYKIGKCTEHQPFPVQPDLQARSNFVIKRTLKGIKIFCGWVEILDFKLSADVCTSDTSSNWESVWEKKIVAVYFDSNDDGSDFYNPRLLIGT